jgi:uncharacterized Ntn-hydrolase superfamily protein
VPWVEAGVGAIATQASGNPEFGVHGLEIMRRSAPSDVLKQLLDNDELADFRQLGLVDVQGRVVAHTGGRCVTHAEHIVSDGAVFLANTMRNPGAPRVMADAWSRTVNDPFEERLVHALLAAEQAGGDLRGRQSAAIEIRGASRDERFDVDASIDLRVDDHDDPLEELSRLLTLRRAQRLSSEARRLAENGDLQQAEEHSHRALELVPDSDELRFRHGMLLAEIGKLDEARTQLSKAFRTHDGWQELLQRLPVANLTNLNPATIAQLNDA